MIQNKLMDIVQILLKHRKMILFLRHENACLEKKIKNLSSKNGKTVIDDEMRYDPIPMIEDKDLNQLVEEEQTECCDSLIFS